MLRLKDRAGGNGRTVTDREDRERESRESDEMLLLRRQREEQEHRHEVAERLREEPTDEPEAEDQTSNERTLRRE